MMNRKDDEYEKLVCKYLKEGTAHLGSMSNAGSCISSITHMHRGTRECTAETNTEEKKLLTKVII